MKTRSDFKRVVSKTPSDLCGLSQGNVELQESPCFYALGTEEITEIFFKKERGDLAVLESAGSSGIIAVPFEWQSFRLGCVRFFSSASSPHTKSV